MAPGSVGLKSNDRNPLFGGSLCGTGLENLSDPAKKLPHGSSRSHTPHPFLLYFDPFQTLPCQRTATPRLNDSILCLRALGAQRNIQLSLETWSKRAPFNRVGYFTFSPENSNCACACACACACVRVCVCVCVGVWVCVGVCNRGGGRFYLRRHE